MIFIKSADKMFEELGYSLDINRNNSKLYTKTTKYGYVHAIEFIKKTGQIKNPNTGYFMTITGWCVMSYDYSNKSTDRPGYLYSVQCDEEEIKAIAKKLKELNK